MQEVFLRVLTFNYLVKTRRSLECAVQRDSTIDASIAQYSIVQTEI